MCWRRLIFLITVYLLQFAKVNSQDSTVIKYENVIYGMVSGTALLMDVYKPQNANGLGILVIPGSAFGYFHSKSYDEVPLKDDFFSDYIGSFSRSLVNRGYTIFIINHRFAPRFHFPDIFYDCQRAVRFIRYNAKKYGIKPGNIGAVGHSSGAGLVAMLGLRDTTIKKAESPVDNVSSKVQTVVTLAAGFILTDLDKKEDSLMAKDLVYQANINYIGFPPEVEGNKFVMSGKYAEASPIIYVSKDDASFLIYHSDDDLAVPVRQAKTMYEKLNSVGIDTKIVLRSKQGHTPEPDLEETDRWLKQHLQ